MKSIQRANPKSQDASVLMNDEVLELIVGGNTSLITPKLVKTKEEFKDKIVRIVYLNGLIVVW